MWKRTVLTILGGLFLSSMCLAQKVRIDFDHGADFSKYHTYRTVKIANNPDVTQLADQRIIAAMEENLAAKGLKKVDSGGDLLVGYEGAITKETQYTTFNDGMMGAGWGWRGGYGGGYGGTGISTTTSSTIPTGVLAVEMFDPAQKQLVFRATASDTLSDKPEKNASKITKAMKKVFEKYPPKAKK